ncbi:inactive tyrosine-protein kinase PEAK1 isoform X1 [Corvus hawaiiensis]|uniref:inactive tyrosine-protein kinase PEAK1 isoform X1 n=1 Tax=Corvus hawaiiensis TaxID=134902 RepID=UPI002018E9C5|nr:inactive tyrosine-protein kinase PEAK1 isoform X1 [Corvus hawaiiensis]XP_048173371.1 inactive tyrosine-protein kinase PEAK1 isoform X1 [Corvus hawaiiensis]XP_048173372.1 inactive tyrosine-protein kinase PEAK1 isoform X1 [Corvus hawaiiensis]XP_048173373.1 inactive tyrosine-protein kinase PEAK1 isoform X1 [Corvus hawaiiensis]XP_048173374.1 inactive tyrosine-protein kinase PEAK1 isoform X1 [Corvus hawaiiensis]XP_048173375.1 inactive tyrosine-protein kinase PEAK1 isoform X1 [Corvus hawaiiensis]
MSACNTFTEHVWKPGECKNCFKPKSLHQLPPVSEKKPLSHGNLKPNANQSNSQRGRNTGSFRPPVAKKPTIAVKPTMMVADGQGLCGELTMLDQCENKPLPAGWNRNKAVLNKKPLNNNNEEEIEGYSHVPRPYGNSEGVGKIPNNNNNGLTEVLKEIAGLDTTPQLTGNETNSRETFLGRINNCYKRSLERKIPPSCMVGGMKDSQSKHVILSGSTEVISNEGGRFCYPEFSSGDESEDDTFFGSMQEEHESWDESDEELLAMEIRMRGQPRFANFRANTLSPVPFCVDKKWNTVPLRNKSLQRICAVDYDDSYDEILNGYGEETVILYGQESMQSMVSSDSTSPDSSLTEESRSGTTSSSSQKLCNGGLSPSTPQDLKVIEPEYESLCDNQQVKDVPKAPRNALKGLETHKAVLALRLEEKDGKIAVQTDTPENKSSSDVAGQAVTINLVPVEEQAKPYRVVNMEQPVCKPYTVVDVSAAMTSECKENQTETSETKKASSNPSSPVTPGTPIASSAASPVRVHANLKKSSAIRYQEVWTSSTSPRQKIPKVELIGNSSGPSVPPRKTSHKSAPTSPTATNISSKTIPVKSPNLSEIKFNSYNNAGMPPFPIIIHDEPTYAKSSKNAIKVPIVINPNAYDNLAIYKSFLGTSGELSIKDKTTSVISHTYEEIETESKATEAIGSKPTELSQAKGVANSSECRLGSVAQKVQEFNSCLSKSQISPQRSHSADHSSPSRVQKAMQEPAAKPDVTPEGSVGSSGGRENASTVLSQIVASIQPPQSPPETPQSAPKSCSVEELYSLPPEGDATKSTLVRPKSLFTSQPEVESSKTENTAIKMQKDPLSQAAATPSPKPARATPSATSPQAEQAPPFPPPRSTSSPYHASNLLQRHFSNWTKPNSPTRSTEAESILHSEGRRPDAKPKRWISFKSFFRRRKADDEEEREKDREKGKLVGLDGTVIHMLPPPPVQRHHWFSEAKSDSSEKPSIVFMYRCEPAQAEPKAELPLKGGVESAIAEALVKDKGETQEKPPESSEQNTVSHSSPPQAPKKIPSTPEHCGINGSPEFQDMIKRLKKALKEFPLMGNCVSEYSGQVPDDPTLDELSPRVPRAVFVKQDNGGSASVIPVVSSSRGPPGEEEKEVAPNSPDLNTCSATYSNLGQSRAAMIPPKQPRQPKGALDDAIAFGGLADQETVNNLQPTPPPLPKKTILRANTEPTPRDLQKQALENNLCIMANPTYDIDTNWEASSACSSVSLELKVLDNESGDSLDRPTEKLRAATSATNSVSSLTTISIKDRCSNSMESLTGRRLSQAKQGRGIQKPQRQALYRGIENREEVVGKIRSLHADSLKKLALKCEDLFMAGQKDQLRFGVDSWSDFRLTSDKPCCEAGDAVYYPASYAKDPLNNYAVKICKSKAKESQQYYHSLSIRQSLAINFNIQQDCGHFLAEVPVRLLPWEDDDTPDVEEEREEEEKEPEQKNRDTASTTEASHKDSSSSQGTISKPRSRVVVITREVPHLTVADFVRESAPRHTKSPDLYERQVCLLLLQLCLGLEHLKPYHITHCDLRLENLLLVHSRAGGSPLSPEATEPSPNTACPARLIVSNFSQAKQKSHMVDPEVLRDQSRLAPEIITATQYKKCDEFQTGILIYEMLHLPNPFDENPELKEKEYTCADLPKIPCRSLYSQGLQQLASCLLNPNPSERILISEAKGILQCLLWGPREDLFHALSTSSNPSRRDAILQNWLDIKRTLLMIKFAEKSLERDCGIILEDWLCCQYLAFATTDSLHRIVRLMKQH